MGCEDTDTKQEDTVGDLLSLIKQNRIVKRYRVRKWKRYSRRMMFTPDEVNYLEGAPDKIREAVYSHIKTNAHVPDSIVKELDIMLSRSYLAGSDEIGETLKTDTFRTEKASLLVMI